jgi:hypothetical protein
MSDPIEAPDYPETGFPVSPPPAAPAAPDLTAAFAQLQKQLNDYIAGEMAKVQADVSGIMAKASGPDGPFRFGQ